MNRSQPKGRDHRDAERRLRVGDGERFPSPSHFIQGRMSENTLSIFIDESGRFQYPDSDSPFYILGMILHDQSQSIEKQVADLERLEEELGLEGALLSCWPTYPQGKRLRNT